MRRVCVDEVPLPSPHPEMVYVLLDQQRDVIDVFWPTALESDMECTSKTAPVLPGAGSVSNL
jgi:hypothetical protein